MNREKKREGKYVIYIFFSIYLRLNLLGFKCVQHGLIYIIET